VFKGSFDTLKLLRDSTRHITIKLYFYIIPLPKYFFEFAPHSLQTKSTLPPTEQYCFPKLKIELNQILVG